MFYECIFLNLKLLFVSNNERNFEYETITTQMRSWLFISRFALHWKEMNRQALFKLINTKPRCVPLLRLWRNVVKLTQFWFAFWCTYLLNSPDGAKLHNLWYTAIFGTFARMMKVQMYLLNTWGLLNLQTCRMLISTLKIC